MNTLCHLWAFLSVGTIQHVWPHVARALVYHPQSVGFIPTKQLKETYFPSYPVLVLSPSIWGSWSRGCRVTQAGRISPVHAVAPQVQTHWLYDSPIKGKFGFFWGSSFKTVASYWFIWSKQMLLLMVCEVSANQREVFVFEWERVCIFACSVFSSIATTSHCCRRAAGAKAAMTTGQFLRPPAASCSRSRQRACEKIWLFCWQSLARPNLFFWNYAGSKNLIWFSEI